MGAASGSLEGNSSEEQVEFWERWNRSTRDQRHEIGVGISKRINELMRSDIKSAVEFKSSLAQYVKTEILGKPGARTAKRGRGRRSY